MICVPTPFHKNGNIPQPNIDHVLSATEGIAPFIKPGDLIILESTSPVGTTEKLTKWISEDRPDLSFPEYSNSINSEVDVAISHCPERVLPGNIIREIEGNDRIIYIVKSGKLEEIKTIFN